MTAEDELAAYRARARDLLTQYRAHGHHPELCDSYYCGQMCSYIGRLDEEDGQLLLDIAGISSVDELPPSAM